MTDIRRLGLIPQVLLSALVLLSVLVWVPAAGATAATGAPPQLGAPGLPDGRVYEQASPTNKYGNEAGISINGEGGGWPPLIAAGPDGNEVLYSGTGPIGETNNGFGIYTVARRTQAGWASHGAVPRAIGLQGIFATEASDIGLSSDLTQTLFTSPGLFTPGQGATGAHVYRYGEDGTLDWIGRPTIANAVNFNGFFGQSPFTNSGLVGASSDYRTDYFLYEGILTPEDEQANPALGNISRADLMQTASPAASNAGLYEWRDGKLEQAAVLPDGYLDPYGATPAGTGTRSEFTTENFRNQVAADGRRFFFVSPDPESGSGRPVELYVRETEGATQRSVLVSRDELLPEAGGLPAGAPSGVVADGEGHQAGYMYASSDGSRVFFQSVDRLTEAAPNDASVKQYEFDLGTNVLEYLPSTFRVNASSSDGSIAVVTQTHVEPEGGSQSLGLDLMSNGQLTQIELLSPGEVVQNARVAANGSVFVFESNATWPGFNNGGGAFFQVYRYDAKADSISCVSCPPAGVVPRASASSTHAYPTGERFNNFAVAIGDRGVSDNGSRVFFDTADPLVPQDTNGVGDVYEWENGSVYLLSSGTGPRYSYFGDNSPSGDDVFFSTIDGIASGDSDKGYDVYDARVPRPGDIPLPNAVPCQGEVCQGPPSVPSLLGSPASATFSGLGNLQPAVKAAVKKKKVTTKRKKKRKRAKAKKSAGTLKSNRRAA